MKDCDVTFCTEAGFAGSCRTVPPACSPSHCVLRTETLASCFLSSPRHSLRDEVVVQLRPVGGAVEGGWRVSHDLEEGARGVHVLQGSLPVSQFDRGDSWNKMTMLEAGEKVKCYPQNLAQGELHATWSPEYEGKGGEGGRGLHSQPIIDFLSVAPEDFLMTIMARNY